MTERIHIGDLVSPHGIRGEVKLYVVADSPDFALQFERFFIDEKQYSVEGARVHKNTVILRLSGIDSRDKAQGLIGKSLYFERGDAELDDGQYFIADIIDFIVTDHETGRCYGRIKRVENHGATDIYYIENDRGENFLFPAAPAFIKEKDFEGGEIKIAPIKGMFDDEGVEVR